MSTLKAFFKRDLYKFFKNDLKQLREVKPLGKASLHKLFHSYFSNTHNFFFASCIESLRRKLMLVTLGTKRVN